MSETYGRSDKMSQIPHYTGYKTWLTERTGNQKGGGGLAIFYKDSLPAHEWSPTIEECYEYIAKERQWLLINFGPSKIAFLNCYIACKVRMTIS